MTTVRNFAKPQGFKLAPEGTTSLLVEAQETSPRDGAPTKAKVTYRHPDGSKIINTYEFDNENALNAYTFLLDACGLYGDSQAAETTIDISQVVGKFIEADIVHNESKGKTYANISRINGVGAPFVVAAPNAAPASAPAVTAPAAAPVAPATPPASGGLV